jgi:phosphofructokinase-like protein
MGRFGILTGGGDAPGLNAVIRAAVRRSTAKGHTVVGILHGWKGLLEKETRPLDRAAISGILHRGGTILGTSRTNPYKKPEDANRLKENFRALGLDALIACGGEDTLGVANRLSAEGFPVVGVPKTIDNDLSGTDVTFGFDTAVTIATEAIDRLHSTAESHDRVIVVEVMGRHAGWIATHAGIAGGADAILIPERPGRIEAIVAAIERRRAVGKNFSIIVVAEGVVLAEESAPGGGAATKPASGPVLKDAATDAFGHVALGGIGEQIAAAVKERTGFDTRTVVLGHVQRGGTPTARDRFLGTLFGFVAADLADRGEFGKMAALRGDRVVAVPIAEGVERLKTVDPDLIGVTDSLLG